MKRKHCVNALHFCIKEKIDNIEKFLYSLNCILPDDINIFELKEVNPNFHAQKSAKYKHYRYVIQNDHVASVFEKDALLYPYCVLNIERMNKSLSYLVGHHDFSAFKSNSDNPYSDCNIYYARASKIIKNRQNFIFIDIVGNRFLYNMIRRIVGQLLKIERNNLNPSIMLEVLNSKDYLKTASIVQALGLYLVYVGYDDVNSYIENQFIKEGK